MKISITVLFLALAAAPFARAADRFVEPFSSDLCLVRANADDVPDIIQWSGDYSTARLVAVDGATGRGLWATDPIPHVGGTYLHCADAATVVVGVSDFTVRALEAATGKERWRAIVSDMPKEAAIGSGCILIESDDGRRAGFTLSSGAPIGCAARSEPGNFRGRLADRGRKPFTVAGLLVTLTRRGQGTPMLTLTARRGKQVAWETPLGVYSNVPWAHFGTLAYDDAGIYVAGRNVAAGISTAVVAVDPRTGRVRWKRDSRGVAFVEVSGGRLYAGFDERTRALDPETGADLWAATLPGVAEAAATPAGRAAARMEALFLDEADLPGLRRQQDDRSRGPEADDDAYRAHAGEHAGLVSWSALENLHAPLWRLVDIRWVFPSPARAAAYLRATIAQTGEGAPPLPAPPAPPGAADLHVFGGTSSIKTPDRTVRITQYYWVFRVGGVVVKLYGVSGPSADPGALTAESLRPLAEKAIARINAIRPARPARGARREETR